VLGVTTGLVGNLMAMEARKRLLGRTEDQDGRFLTVEALRPEVRPLRFTRRQDCAACGDEPEVDARTPDDYAPRVCDT
jgi:molybdopterin/thiamine biosynthesis adenylyltransferase